MPLTMSSPTPTPVRKKQFCDFSLWKASLSWCSLFPLIQDHPALGGTCKAWKRYCTHDNQIVRDWVSARCPKTCKYVMVIVLTFYENMMYIIFVVDQAKFVPK